MSYHGEEEHQVCHQGYLQPPYMLVHRQIGHKLLGHNMCNPPPQIGEEIPTNRRTNRQTDFSAKQAPTALDLSPRLLTHLPYGCSIVAFMWKRKISLNFQIFFFVSLSVSTWSLSCDIAVHSGPVVYA